MTVIYLPVVTQEKNKDYRFWESNNPYFFYPYMLVTPFVSGMNIKRDYFGKAKLNISADSGGYQAVTLNKDADPIGILQWQERVADRAFTLDVPPHYFGSFYSRLEFLKCMYQSNKNADLMWKSKVNDDMQLWGVVQGKNYKQCKEWYYDLTKDYEYDGYSISLSVHQDKSDISGWIEQLQFASTIPKRVHFLGFSEPLFNTVLSKLSHKNKISYTFDTSSTKLLAIYGNYRRPITLSPVSFSKYERRRDDITSLPCICPVCSKHTVEDMIDISQLRALHNLYVKTQFCELANLVAEDDELFMFLLSWVIGIRNYYVKKKDSIISLVKNLIYGEEPNITVIKLDEFKGRALELVNGNEYLRWFLEGLK